MSNYTQTTAFTPKDSLSTGNPAKIIKGADFDVEFSAIAAAVATKADTNYVDTEVATLDASKADSAATAASLALKSNLLDTVSVISTNTTAVAYTVYVLTATLTLTLPASPAVGSWVTIVNRSGTTTPVIGRNSQNIMGLAEDMTIDNANASITLTFADATRGWVWN
jgi:hypothetical protein